MSLRIRHSLIVIFVFYLLDGARTGPLPDSMPDPEESAGLFEGDMILSDSQVSVLGAGGGIQGRNGLIQETRRWPDGIVYYKITGDFGELIMFMPVELQRGPIRTYYLLHIDSYLLNKYLNSGSSITTTNSVGSIKEKSRFSMNNHENNSCPTSTCYRNISNIIYFKKSTPRRSVRRRYFL